MAFACSADLTLLLAKQLLASTAIGAACGGGRTGADVTVGSWRGFKNPPLIPRIPRFLIPANRTPSACRDGEHAGPVPFGRPRRCTMPPSRHITNDSRKSRGRPCDEGRSAFPCHRPPTGRRAPPGRVQTIASADPPTRARGSIPRRCEHRRCEHRGYDPLPALRAVPNVAPIPRPRGGGSGLETHERACQPPGLGGTSFSPRLRRRGAAVWGETSIGALPPERGSAAGVPPSCTPTTVGVHCICRPAA